jgi:hypothetical protein
MKCCRSSPRCKRCPVLLARGPVARELAALRQASGADRLPPHLAGVPPCLHKYESLLRRAWSQRAVAG